MKRAVVVFTVTAALLGGLACIQQPKSTSAVSDQSRATTIAYATAFVAGVQTEVARR